MMPAPVNEEREAGKTLLSTQAHLQPVPTRTFDEFCALKDRKLLLSFLGYGKAKRGEPPKPRPNNDPFFSPSYRFVEADPLLFFKLHDMLPIQHRNLCIVVQPDMPVHLFIDLDDKTRVRNAAKTRAAFERLFAIRFKLDFKRDADLSGMQWYGASTPTSYSDHGHCRTIVFKTCAQLNGYMQTRFLPWVKERAMAADPDALMLGELTYIANQTRPEWTSFVDKSVWSMRRSFRLSGHCKPAKTHLTPVPAMCDRGRLSPPSEHEYLWRSLVTYTLVAPPDKWCEWKEQVTDQKRSAGDGKATVARSVDTSGMTPPSWTQGVRIPWFDRRGWPQPQIDRVGIFGSNGEAFVRYRQGDTACCHCSDVHGKRVVHETNHSYLTLKPDGTGLRFRSWRAECKEFEQFVPLPRRDEVDALPKNLRELSAYLAQQNFPALRPAASARAEPRVAPASVPMEEEKKEEEQSSCSSSSSSSTTPFRAGGTKRQRVEGEVSLLDMVPDWVTRQRKRPCTGPGSRPDHS
jgi:hypothetical protein